MLESFLCAAFLAAALAPAPRAQQGDAVRTDYIALFEGREKEGLLELWKEHPGEILTTIDADLEGSLALWERSPDAPDKAAIAHLQERALWGAEIASELTRNPIFADYAASFVGWNDEQKRSFRAGQKAFGKSRKALESGDAKGALAAARDCIERARELGDWWGLAMGLQSEGEALALGETSAAAAAALAQARQINHDLGLSGAEYACSLSLARLLVAKGPTARARAALGHATALGSALGDKDGQAQFAKLRAELESRAR
jgi:hypothetical protein